jgi:hypothetical protein
LDQVPLPQASLRGGTLVEGGLMGIRSSWRITVSAQVMLNLFSGLKY